MVSCLAELTSALPYIGYLTVLISADLHWGFVLILLVLYNLILFNLPLYALYFVSVRYDEYLVKIYTRFHRLTSIIIDKGLPVIGIILGLISIYYGVNQL